MATKPAATEQISGRLARVAIARELFSITPDRDVRASQLCMEMLLTLAANEYRAPDSVEHLHSPKQRHFAIRSLATGRNFLEGDHTDIGDMTLERYGQLLTRGADFRGSHNLELVRSVLEGLIDPSTVRGKEGIGSQLLFPFHESLLWYDARRDGKRGTWGVRQVYMRAQGVGLARLLLDPPGDVAALASAAVGAIRAALNGQSPIATVAEHIERPTRRATTDDQGADGKDVEEAAWTAAGATELTELARQVAKHAEGIMLQEGASDPAKLWQLRAILALDFACHMLRAAWNATDTPPEQRYLLFSFGGPPRALNKIRQKSEASFQQSRMRLGEATVKTLAGRMAAIWNSPGRESVNWEAELGSRATKSRAQATRIAEVATELAVDEPAKDFDDLASRAYERADYNRAIECFRVLMESIGAVSGTGQYRFLTASPDLLNAMVGALSAEMSKDSAWFFRKIADEWGIIASPERATGTDLYSQVDGAELGRNGRRAEDVLVAAGLAVALSDRTAIVGERAARHD